MRLNEFGNEKLAKYKTAAAADAKKADAAGDFARGDKRFKGINTATKKQFANDAKKSQLKEFAPSGDDGDGFSDETLKRLAAQWYNGDEDPRVEQTLMSAGWEIGQDEGYDNGGVFVVRAGDDQGDSYISWPAEDLQMNEVAPPGAKAERMVRHIKQGYAKDGKLTPKEKGIAFATAWKAHNAGKVEEQGVTEAAQGHTIEAHGVRGMDRRTWHKTFRNTDQMIAWAEKHDAEIVGTRDLEQARQDMAEGHKESYIIVRTDREGKKDVFAGNFDTYERAQKELDACLAHPLHTKHKQKFEIKRKGHKDITEMDKSQPSAGRDTGPREGPEGIGKPITKEKMVKRALDALAKSMAKKDDKKKDVSEDSLNEFARGEGGYGPFKIYIGHDFTDKQFPTFKAARDAIELLQNNDPATADSDWRIVNGTGRTVWEHVPASASDDLAENSLSAMRRLAGIVPQVPLVVPNGQRQYRHMPTAVQPR